MHKISLIYKLYKKIGFLQICRNPYFIGISTIFFIRKNTS